MHSQSSHHSRSLASLLVMFALLLGGLLWLSPGAVSRRAESRSDAFESTRAATTIAPVELETGPAIARAPAASTFDEPLVVEPPTTIERRLADFALGRDGRERFQLGGSYAQSGFAFGPALETSTSTITSASEAPPTRIEPARFPLYSSKR